VTAAAFNQSSSRPSGEHGQEQKSAQRPRVRRANPCSRWTAHLVEVVKDTAPMQVGGLSIRSTEMVDTAGRARERSSATTRTSSRRCRKPPPDEGSRLPNGISNSTRRSRHRQFSSGRSRSADAQGTPQHRLESSRRANFGLFDEAQAGNFDLAISAIVSTLMDPRTSSAPVRQGRALKNYSAGRTPRPRRRKPGGPRARRQPAQGAGPQGGDILDRSAAHPWRTSRSTTPGTKQGLHGQNPSTFFGI